MARVLSVFSFSAILESTGRLAFAERHKAYFKCYSFKNISELHFMSCELPDVSQKDWIIRKYKRDFIVR